MKAQRVKNAVIVPAGAKGGFVVKQPPDRSPRRCAPRSRRATACSSAVCSTSPTTSSTARSCRPTRVVRYDGDDPYLVVAADKGTATFSDIANEIALARGFWLGDAFASGGEHGYDHKAMGITARGAWESVQAALPSPATSIPTATTSRVVGIGDMSGDVFGNGMLLSQHIKLVAAFDHRHVFLDPDARSCARRSPSGSGCSSSPARRGPTTTPSLISTGGGVYPRTVKSITMTPEVRDRARHSPTTSTRSHRPSSFAPTLRAPVDLSTTAGSART